MSGPPPPPNPALGEDVCGAEGREVAGEVGPEPAFDGDAADVGGAGVELLPLPPLPLDEEDDDDDDVDGEEETTFVGSCPWRHPATPVTTLPQCEPSGSPACGSGQFPSKRLSTQRGARAQKFLESWTETSWKPVGQVSFAPLVAARDLRIVISPSAEEKSARIKTLVTSKKRISAEEEALEIIAPHLAAESDF